MIYKAMACGQAKHTIQRSLDALLPPEERSALQVHLEGCADCRQELDAQRRLARLTNRWASRAVAAADPGEEWTAQVLARLETPPARARLQVWLALTATLLLLGALALVPGIRPLSFGVTAQNVVGLPNWLQANLAALPGDAHAVLRAPSAALLPAWSTALLLGVILLNAGFCVHARQRSFS